MPSPVTRIAPKQDVDSEVAAKLNVGFEPCLMMLPVSSKNHIGFARQIAARTRQRNSDKPAARDAALLVPAASSSVMTRGDTFMKNRFQMQAMISFARLTTSNGASRFFRKSQSSLRVALLVSPNSICPVNPVKLQKKSKMLDTF